MAITQTVDIPADYRLTIDVPREVPVGPVVLTFTPAVARPDTPLKALAGAATPRADRLLGAAANLGSITLDEIREEKLAKHLV
jgi:hypothetical protein